MTSALRFIGAKSFLEFKKIKSARRRGSLVGHVSTEGQNAFASPQIASVSTFGPAPRRSI